MSDEDERYDRLEALGEWRFENGDPEVWDDEYWDSVLEAPTCPLDGGQGVLLGTLGSLTHYRCRACGIGFSARKENAA